MGNKLLMICAVAMMLCFTACSVQRPGLLVIEPNYSHMRDPLVTAPGGAVGVTAGADADVFADDWD